MKSDIPSDISTDVMKDFMKSHSGKLFVPKKMKRVLNQKKLGGVLKGRQVTKKDALKAIEALQEEGMVHKYKTPSQVLKRAIKKYESHAGMKSAQREALEKRKKQRREKMLEKFTPDKQGTADRLMQEKKEFEMRLKKREMRKKGLMKEFKKEEMELLREQKAIADREKTKPHKSDKDKKEETESVMRMDF